MQGHPIAGLRSRKGYWLLALLALRGGSPVEREWLAATLWPDSPQTKALANLRLCLTDLRHVLGEQADLLQAPTARTLRMEATKAFVDVLAFDSALSRGDVAGWQSAIALYRGPLLENCDEAWIVPERETRAEAYRTLLERLASHYRQTQSPRNAVPYLRKLVASDPLRESAQRALMQALDEAGDEAAVAQVYRDFCLYLVNELGLEPDTATTELYRKIRAQQQNPNRQKSRSAMTGSSSPAALRALPTPLTPLIGRETAVEEIRACLQTTRLLTIKGPGGIGKTRIVLEIGSRLQESYSGGIWFVALASLLEPQRLAYAVRKALKLPEDPPDPFAQLVARFSVAPSLLILDNFEHLAEEGRFFVRELLEQAPLLTCMVTSREALNLTSERIYALSPLTLPTRTASPKQLMRSASAQLFLERAIARNGALELNEENTVAVRELCRQLDGIPLAIELAAAWVDVMSVSQINAMLSTRLMLLSHPQGDLPERHKSLEAVLSASYSRLGASEQRLLRCLSVFQGGCLLEAVEAVYAEDLQTGSGADSARKSLPEEFASLETLRLLKRLVEKSLLLTDESREPRRYLLLETTRQYAAEQCSAEEVREWTRRHADYFLRQALAARDDSDLNDTRHFYAQQMRPDQENYLAALAWWRNVDEEMAQDMMLALSSLLLYPFRYDEVNALIARLAHGHPPIASAVQARLHIFAGQWAQWLGNSLWQARRLLVRAYRLALGCENRLLMAMALVSLGSLGTLARDGGHYVLAKKYLRTALRHATAVRSKPIERLAQQIIISIFRKQGDYTQAEQLANQFLRTGQEQRDAYTEQSAWCLLADIAFAQSDYSRARNCWEQSLKHVVENDIVSRANTLMHLGGVARQQEDFAAARDYFQRALAVALQYEATPRIANAYSCLAKLALQLGDYSEALEHIRRSVDLYASLGEGGGQRTGLYLLALLKQHQRQSEWAICLYSAYIRLTSEAGWEAEPDYQVSLKALDTFAADMDVERFRVCQERGEKMELKEALACGFSDRNPMG